MTKRLVEIDDALLERAQEVLGSATMTATVNGALAEVVKAAERRRHLLDIERHSDLSDPAVMADAWR